MREELKAFYWYGDEERSKDFAEKCFRILDSKVTPDMSVTAQKLLQYDVISDEFEPVIFRNSPFYYETGFLTSLSDGLRYAKNLHHVQANGWTFERNKHLYHEQSEDLDKRRIAQGEEKLYLICGDFNDNGQHFNFNNRPILEGGLKGIYEKAKNEIKNAQNDDEREFLNSVCHAMLVIKKMSEKFSEKAASMAESENDQEIKQNLLTISATAKRVPWEKPSNLYEALNTIAFMRKVMGSLEGVGPNTFGRLDMDLYPFYKADIENGTLTEKEAYDLICQFLIIWDMHYDHNMIMAGYADHELENTYVIGGCDINGNPLYNELTRMFIVANREENIIFPKIKCRFSAESPKEYFDEINKSIINGTSTILYQNDDAVIPALVRGGRTIEEARDYLVTGCWSIADYNEKSDHGSYLNLLKAFEFALHSLHDKIKKVRIDFEVFDGSESFEELYAKIIRNSRRLIEERISITREGGNIYHKVDRLPVFSSTLNNCMEKHADFTEKGGKYRGDYLLMFGLPNIVDSLMAIKTLVYDEKKYTLRQMIDAVKANWAGYETMRSEAIKCHGWGDGNEDSCALANRFNNDLYAICDSITGSYGGKVHMGHLTYTEIRWWGEKTLATPDGRRNGEYFAQGLTPSRLKRIPSVTDVIRSLAALDPSTMAANSVVNIILPSGKTDLNICESFLRAAAHSALQCLQLNCTSKETLLDAQKHPEKYPELIVRVTGFSAKFTSLTKEWQDEVLTRNFYD